MKNIKVLLVARKYMPDMGGASVVYHELCKRLSPKISVVAQFTEGSESFDSKQNYKIYRVEDIDCINPSIKVLFNLLNVVKKENPDIICFGHISQSNLALFFNYFTKRKCILYAHGEEILYNNFGRLLDGYKSLAIKNLDGIICVSNFTKRELVKNGADEKKVVVINNAVDCSIFNKSRKDASLARKWGLFGKKVIITVSRLERRKNHEAVIRALPNIIGKVPNVLYLIVGKGEEEQNLKSLIKKLKLDKHVKFVGFVQEKDKVKYYNLCDLFVMPNITLETGWTEGFGIVFLEANACGKPVIGGNAGGVPDAIKDGYNGYLVDGNNINEIEEKIVKLLSNNKLRKKMGANARKWAERFTYEKQVSKFLDVCNELVSGK